MVIVHEGASKFLYILILSFIDVLLMGKQGKRRIVFFNISILNLNKIFRHHLFMI